jgi:hypothetical protein
MRIFAIVAAAAVLLVAGCVAGPRLALWYWDHQLAESLPPGSALIRVSSFFEAKHLDHSYDAMESLA